MKILVSLTYYTPNISGITLYAESLVRELARRGHQVTVVTSQHVQSLPRLEKKENIITQRIPVTFQVGKGPIMMSFPWRILKLVGQADVVNCHLPQFESSMVVIIAKLLRKKVVLTHHCDLSWKGVGPYFVVLVVYISQLIAATLADTIVVYTKDYAEHSWFLRLFQKKLVQLYPPVDIPKLSNKKDHEFKKGIVHIGFVGRIVHEKGLQYLLNAIPLLLQRLKKPLRIWLIGPTTEVVGEYYLDKLQTLINKYKEYIILTGKIDHEDLGDYYKNLDVLVLSSDDSLEAFGIVQVEAMLMGTPVVATNLPGVRVPIQETGMGIIIPPRDPQAIANAIIKIQTNKKQYVKPQETIRKLFAVDTTMGNYERIFSARQQ